MITLPNGAEAHLVPGEGPLALVLEVGAGSRHDPVGAGGLAELTGRTLVAGTHGRQLPGELKAALSGVAGSASVRVGPLTTALLLEDVRDVAGALDVSTEMLSDARFPQAAVARAREEIAERVALGGPVVTRLAEEAADLLRVAPVEHATPFSVAALRQQDVRAFHRRHYRPDVLRLALRGAELPETGELLAMLSSTVGRWEAPDEPLPSRPSTPLSPHPVAPRVLVGGRAALAVGFPTPPSGATAALAALRAAAPEEGFEVLGATQTAAGLTSTDAVGDVLVLAGPASEPDAALRRLLRELRRVERRGPRRGATRELRRALQEEGAAAALAWLESARGRPSPERSVIPAPAWLARVDALAQRQVTQAARELLEGPRSVVAALPSPEDAARWAEHEAVVRGLDEPADPAARARRQEAAEWIERAVQAHGGDAFRGLERFTMLGRRLVKHGDAARPLGEQRLDVDLETMHVRQETRPRSPRSPIHLVLFDGRRARMGREGPELNDLASRAFGNTFYRLAPVVLHRSTRDDVEARVVGWAEVRGRRARELETADPRAGLTRLALDAETGWLVRVSYENRFPHRSEPQPVTVVFDAHAPREGVVLHGHEAMSSGDASVESVFSDLSWSFPEPPWDPLQVETTEDDLARTLEAKGAPSAGAESR